MPNELTPSDIIRFLVLGTALFIIVREVFIWFIGINETNKKLDKIIKLLEKKRDDFNNAK